MRLIPDWRRVLARAWSIRLLALLILFSGLEVALPFFDGTLPISRPRARPHLFQAPSPRSPPCCA